MTRVILDKLTQFRKETSGAALVEFAISLPLLLIIFAVLVEGTRITWSYQAAVSGVRDATRMVARLAPDDICTGTANIADFQTDALDIVRYRSGTTEQILPTGVTVTNVAVGLDCTKAAYTTAQVPVIEVRADVQVTLPFGRFFSRGDGSTMNAITTQIVDQTRVYGI